jgi:hypothetical protein
VRRRLRLHRRPCTPGTTQGRQTPDNRALLARENSVAGDHSGGSAAFYIFFPVLNFQMPVESHALLEAACGKTMYTVSHDCRLTGVSFVVVHTLTIVLAFLLCPSRTLADTRIWQPLILEAKQLRVLVGRPQRQLEVLAEHDRKLEPIPFQIDERTADGLFSFSSVHQASSSTKGLSPNDQIVMMVSDLGHVCNVPCNLPPSTLEISVFTPSDRTTRYAYIATVEKPTLSPKSYVDYDATTDRIETNGYRLTFVNGFPADFALQATQWSHRPNMITAFQILGKTKLFGLVLLRLTNIDIQSRVVGFRAGPVRLIRQVLYWVKLPFGIGSPKVTSDELFYRNFGVMPLAVKLPWVPHLLFNKTSFRLAVELNNANRYSLLWPGANNGRSRISELAASGGDSTIPADWIAIEAEDGLLVQTFAPTPDLALIERQLYYQADDSLSSSLGADQHAIVGLQIDKLEKLSKGGHGFDPLFIAVSGGHNVSAMFRELSEKPVVTVQPATMPAEPRQSVRGYFHK